MRLSDCLCSLRNDYLLALVAAASAAGAVGLAAGKDAGVASACAEADS